MAHAPADTPAGLAAFNAGFDYDELAAAVHQHDHPSGGNGFIDCCVRNGWLKRA